MTRVFVSHASADVAFAEKFSNDLRAFGVDVWLDSSHMGPGDFVARISAALQRDVLILILTPAAIASPWVQQEMNAAITRANQKLMRSPIVVLAAACAPEQIPPLWAVYHHYDTTRDYMAAFATIVRELDSAPSTFLTVAPPQPPVSATPSAPTPLTRTPASVAPTIATIAPPARFPEGATSYRRLPYQWALVGGAAVVTAAALVVFGQHDISQDLAGAVALALQSAAVGTASLVSTFSTRYRMRHVALVVVCEAALGLNALWWLFAVASGGISRLLDQLPAGFWYALLALTLLAVVYALCLTTKKRGRWQRVAAIYGITMAGLGVFLLVNYFLVGFSDFLGWPTPLSVSGVAMALLATVYALNIARRRQWPWLVVICVLAAATFAPLTFERALLRPLFGDDTPTEANVWALLWALLTVAPLVFGLFAKNDSSLTPVIVEGTPQ